MSYFSLEEENQPYSDSQGNSSGITSNQPTRTGGRQGFGQNFNGADNIINLTNAAVNITTLNSSFTISMWINAETVTPNADTMMVGDKDTQVDTWMGIRYDLAPAATGICIVIRDTANT